MKTITLEDDEVELLITILADTYYYLVDEGLEEQAKTMEKIQRKLE